MKLAVVTDTPRLSRPAEKYIDTTLEAIAAAAGVADLEVTKVAAVLSQANMKPTAKQVRDERPEFMERLALEHADAVLSCGSIALNAMAGASKQLTLKSQHGMGRWAELCSDEDTCLDRVFWVPTVDAWRVVLNPDLHRDWTNAAWKALTQRGPLPAMDVDTRVAEDADHLRALLDELEGASVVGVDVETTGLKGYADAVTCWGLGAVYSDTEAYAVVVPHWLLGDERVLDLLWDATWRRERRSVGHNFKFDMQFLEPYIGWAPDGARTGDTLLMAHLLDERPNRPNARARGSGLKDLVAQRYDHEYGFDFGKPYDSLTDEERDALHAYLGEDVAYTARLWLDLEREAVEEGSRVLETHDRLLVPVSRAIARAETVGAPIDVPWVQAEIGRLSARAARREAALVKRVATLAPTMVVTNVLAPQQVADVMYDEWGMTPDMRVHGKIDTKRSTDQDHVKAAVEKYRKPAFRDTHYWTAAGWLTSLIRLRKDVRLASVYRKQLLDMMDENHRVHPGFLLHGASTGRISAREPAIQTIPAVDDRELRNGTWWYKLRDGSWVTHPMRRAFAAAPGRQWVEVDYSQLELRVAAGVTQDEAFIEVFRGGRDVHREIAASIFSKAPEDISKGERFLAKAVSFGILYGRSAKALAGGDEMNFAVRELWDGDESRRWDEAKAQLFINKFLRSYPALQAWTADLHKRAPVEGYVETYHGRRRRFPLVTEREVDAIRRQAVNTPIQGAASDLCLEAFTAITREVEAQGLDAVVLFPVHDSICIEVADEDVGRLEQLCRSIMEVDFMGCPLKVDFEYGPNWADVSSH